jgi:hypothetical protein
MIQKLNMHLKNNIENHKNNNTEEIKKNQNMFPNKKTLKRKKDHKNQKEITYKIFYNNKKFLNKMMDFNKVNQEAVKEVVVDTKKDTTPKKLMMIKALMIKAVTQIKTENMVIQQIKHLEAEKSINLNIDV